MNYLKVYDNRLKLYMEQKIAFNKENNKKLIILIVLINVLNLLDIVTTYIGLHILKNAKELNPFMQMLQNENYFSSIAVIKVLYMVFFSLCFYFAFRLFRKRFLYYPLIISFIAFYFVVCSNIINLLI